jgi:hypothetical protein
VNERKKALARKEKRSSRILFFLFFVFRGFGYDAYSTLDVVFAAWPGNSGHETGLTLEEYCAQELSAEIIEEETEERHGSENTLVAMGGCS